MKSVLAVRFAYLHFSVVFFNVGLGRYMYF
jgi:hypothetical protein